MLFVFQDILGVVLEIIIGHVVHAILSELGACHLFGGGFHLVIIDLHLSGGHKLFLDEVPLEFLDAGVEMLIDILVVLVFVVHLHHAAEQVLGECKFAHLLLGVFADVGQELEVGLRLQLSFESLLDLGAELLLTVDHTLTEDGVKQFLIDLSLHET